MGRDIVSAFEADAEIIVQALSDFYERSISGEGPVIHQPPMSKLVAGMELSALVRDGRTVGGEDYPGSWTSTCQPSRVSTTRQTSRTSKQFLTTWRPSRAWWTIS